MFNLDEIKFIISLFFFYRTKAAQLYPNTAKLLIKRMFSTQEKQIINNTILSVQIGQIIVWTYCSPFDECWN